MRTWRTCVALLAAGTAAVARPGAVRSDPPPAIAGRFVGPRTIAVEGRFLPPRTGVVVEVDLAEPHASVACLTAWRAMAQVDARGILTARIRPRAGPCELACPRASERMLVTVRLADHRVLATLVRCAGR